VARLTIELATREVRISALGIWYDVADGRVPPVQCRLPELRLNTGIIGGTGSRLQRPGSGDACDAVRWDFRVELIDLQNSFEDDNQARSRERDGLVVASEKPQEGRPFTRGQSSVDKFTRVANDIGLRWEPVFVNVETAGVDLGTVERIDNHGGGSNDGEGKEPHGFEV